MSEKSPARVDPALLILGIAESVSNVGNWITMMAVYALIVFRGSGGIGQSSGIMLAGLLPTLLASPLAGWLCDRFDRRRLMIISELLSGLVVAALIFVERIELIYAILALNAVTTSLMTPARQSAVPEVVPPENLTRANAFLQQLSSLVKIGAPMLAGAVLSLLNPHQAILLDVVSYALSALILTRLPALPPEKAQKVESGPVAPRENLLSTLRTLPLLQLLFATSFFTITLIVGLDVLFSVFTRDVLRSGESMFGLLIALIGVGTLVSTIILMRRRTPGRPWRDVILGLALLSIIPVTLAVSIWNGDPRTASLVAALGCLIGGAGNGLVIVQSGTLLQTLAPRPLLGRFSGIYQSVVMAGQLFGILITPLLVPALLDMGSFFALMTVLLAGLIVAAGLLVRKNEAASGSAAAVEG